MSLGRILDRKYLLREKVVLDKKFWFGKNIFCAESGKITVSDKNEDRNSDKNEVFGQK